MSKKKEVLRGLANETEKLKSDWLADPENAEKRSKYEASNSDLAKAIDAYQSEESGSQSISKARELLDDQRGEAEETRKTATIDDGRKTLRQQLEANESFGRFVKAGGKGTSAAFEIKALTTAPAVSGGSTGPNHENLGGLIDPVNLGVKDQRPTPRFALTDLVTHIPVGGPLLEYTRLISDHHGAEAVEVAEGSAKPKGGGIRYQKVTDRTRTIAVLFDVSVQALEDIAQLEALIVQMGTKRIRARINAQVLAGDGTGENLTGLNNIVGVQTYTPPGGEAALVSLLKQIDLVENGSSSTEDESFTTADFVAMHPSTSMSPAFKLATNTTTGEFLYLDPRQRPSQFGPWGLPEVNSKKIAVGRLWTGDSSLAVLYEQAGIEVRMFEQNNDNAEKNMVTVRLETRVGFGVWMPAAFCRTA